MLFGEEEIVKIEPIYTKSLWLDQIIGQPDVLKQIDMALSTDRYPHCSIISGPSGSGQLLVGLHVIQTLLCKSPNKPCGCCSGCYKVNGLMHPDLHFSFPVVGAGEECVDHYQEFREAIRQNPFMNVQNWLSSSENENKQANISAKEARSIVDRLYFKPFEANCSILLLWLPEYLAKESNILLKLLEEPPGNSFIVMVTEDIKSLLPTVKSRAQEFKLRPVNEDILTEYLINNKGLERSIAKEYAIASEGNIALCLKWVEDQNVKFLDLIKLMFQKAYRPDPLAYLEFIEQIAALSRDEQKQLFGFLNNVLSLCLRAKMHSLDQSVDSELWNYANRISAKLTLESIEKIADLSDDCIFGILRNANIRILLLDYLIKLSTFIR